MGLIRVGMPLPRPVIYNLTGTPTGLVRVRICKDCGQRWTTVEVPLYWYPVGYPAEYCLRHVHQGIANDTFNLDKALARPDRFISRGIESVLNHGGVYRRRECRKCGARWSTIETVPEGVVVEDVSKCTNCKGNSRIKFADTRQRRRQQAYVWLTQHGVPTIPYKPSKEELQRRLPNG